MTTLAIPSRIFSEPTEADRFLAASTQALIAEGTPPNTVRAYNKAWKEYGKWCRTTGRMAFPSTPETLASYVDHLAASGNSPRTIKARIGCIRRMHREAGFKGHPDTGLAEDALTAVAKRWAKAGGRRKAATPLVIETVRSVVAVCDLTTPAGLRNRALILLGLTMYGRRSEVTDLDIPDVAEAPNGLDVLIKMSKTDKEAEGETVFIPRGDHEETCPVRATRAWLDELARHGISTGPLFRSIDMKRRIAGSPERPAVQSVRLTGKSVNVIVRQLALKAGLPQPSGYTAHSLRAGGATIAYMAGAPLASITEQGRWSDKSPTVLGYIRAVDRRENNAMKGVGL